MSDGWNEVSTFDAVCMVLFNACASGVIYIMGSFLL